MPSLALGMVYFVVLGLARSRGTARARAEMRFLGCGGINGRNNNIL